MPRLTPNTAPPPDYYANNLVTVAAHAVAHSGDLLGPERHVIEQLLALSNQGKRLIARLIMRTTPVIRVDSLNYAEISNLEATLGELEDCGLVERNGIIAADSLLDRLKVGELKELFPELKRPKDRKQDLVQRILGSHTDQTVRTRCAAQVSWLVLALGPALQRLRLTYFGDLYRDLTEFVMRDLGMSAFEDYPLGDNARAFASTEEVEHYLELSSLQFLPANRRAAAQPWLLGHPLITEPKPDNRSLRRRRDKLLIGWGRDFERASDHSRAHACYRCATAHPARERRVRMLKKDGEEAAGSTLLARIKEAPHCAEEALFAQRFGQRGGNNRSTPWQETTWHTSHAQLPGVETLTAQRLTANGGAAWHTENTLLPSLLGLAFWDIIFAPKTGMFTHPFQSAPRDIYWPDFRERRADVIADRLEECGNADALWARIYSTAAEKAGRSCRLVSWGAIVHNDSALLGAAQASFDARTLQAVFDYMLNDLGQVRSGMPDLFVAYGNGNYELVEVKGPSDQLQPNQRVWLKKLCELGVPCRVIKHKFIAA